LRKGKKEKKGGEKKSRSAKAKENGEGSVKSLWNSKGTNPPVVPRKEKERDKDQS